MRPIKQALVLILVSGMLTPALSAQSVWQKMKQAAKQVEKNAEAQSRQTHAAQQASTNAPAEASAQPAAAAGSSASSASSSVTQPAADLSSPAVKALYRKLDVGGVQLGMTPKAAQAALQSRNRALAPSPQSFGYTDLPNVRFTNRIDFKQPGPMVESLQLSLTLQPMQPEVLSIVRSTQFNENNAPTVANTVAALRAKYGPETTSKANSSVTTLTWIFDGEGRLVPEKRATDYNRDLMGWCASGEIQLDVQKWVPSGFGQKKFCAPLTVVRAELGEWSQNRKNSHGQSLPPGMLFNMQVIASSYPMLVESVDATRNMVFAAKAARQQQEKKAADKNAAPL